MVFALSRGVKGNVKGMESSEGEKVNNNRYFYCVFVSIMEMNPL